MSQHQHTTPGAQHRDTGPAPTARPQQACAPAPPFPAKVPRPHASETAEREAALARGRARRLQAERGEHAAAAGRTAIWAANPAFAALADNVRDYAIFLLDRDGVITFWGEGAHLMKWWAPEEAEGAHLAFCTRRAVRRTARPRSICARRKWTASTRARGPASGVTAPRSGRGSA
ncbi:MAG: hypothetical protein KY467_07435 [Gemmatimonadetes bacterium]|nr:hypothetical protein [Gemmatimonadota bacterium]